MGTADRQVQCQKTLQQSGNRNMKKGSGTILVLFVIYISVAQSFEIGSLRIVPKKDFEYNSLIKAKNDTLEIASSTKYVIFPFGEISNIDQLRSSLLKDFKILSSKTEDSIYQYYELAFKCNILTLVVEKDVKKDTFEFKNA